MQISKKQRAIINAAVKPFKLTSNNLGPRLQRLIKYYTKFFWKRRFLIVHHLPVYKNCRDNYILTLLFNTCLQKGGLVRRRRPLTWNFYGNVLLTKYGRNRQRKERKNKRKKARRQKSKSKKPNVAPVTIHVEDETGDETNSMDTNSTITFDVNDTNQSAAAAAASTTTATKCDLNKEKGEEVVGDDVGEDEVVENIWNLDIQEVAALITESGTDEKQLSECTNGDIVDDSSEMSAAREESGDSEPIDQNCVDEESQENNTELAKSSGGDINEKIRQQLKLLKMGKSDNSLFTTKDAVRPSTSTRSSVSLSRRSNSNVSDDSSTNNTNLRRSISNTNAKPSHELVESLSNSPKERDNANATKTSTEEKDDSSKSKAIGGLIDTLFNKFQSMNSNLSTRTRIRSVNPAAKPAKRDDHMYACEARIDLNQDDSNQSATSVSMEFLGFDISNKNVDVSALLPTPKVSATNDQAAFVSEYLDTFMKENLLEKSNDQITFTPKRCSTDEALMTIDALPPNLSVPERPLAMQRPRTLAEKRMILQQQNDIGIFIIENESTVYHELKKRVKQGSNYDNTLVRSIQDANIPFTRDCWRAACWISTPNNRFFYRTMLYNGEEIKLSGSRGDNPKKVAFELKCDDIKKPPTGRSLQHILAECPKKCPPIDGVKINNISSIIGDTKTVDDEASHTKERFGILKKARLCMFSREYLTPGPKCQKVKCKANRKSSFDLEYGPLELVQLPVVQLEVWPQIGVPFSDQIKPLLKTIPINSNIITPEWAKFAVSVVREAPKQTKHRRKYKKPEQERPQRIVFDIPYENNEKKILIRRRRRSSIIFNKDDTVNEHIESFYQDHDKDQLSFAKHVDPSDTVSVECADILTNMIESIAIAVNDTNFIKQDPDIDYVGKVVPISAQKDSAKADRKAEKDKPNTKSEKTSKTKLIKELKRLNVTVIDTANEMLKSKKAHTVCQKVFCKMGCVCESIDTARYIQTHCQRPNCMFECTCVNSPFKEGNPFNLDNSLDMLQARANARLAKEEKEFKSTIIVSENDMFVLPNTSTATKRSSKKPKRFTNDETYLEDTETEAIFKSKRRRPAEKVTEPKLTEHRKHKDLLRSLQHVRVQMNQLPDLGVEPWCLVHCLYKCHCKGRAQRGRIFNFTNKKNDLTAPGGWDTVSPRKRQYTFERENAIPAGDEPIQKNRKVQLPEPKEEEKSHDEIAARTSGFNWRIRPRRTPQALKMLRNECMFAEDPKIELLNERIMKCRQFNHAQNTLNKSMENSRLVQQAKSNAQNGAASTSAKSSNESLHRLNEVITKTMRQLSALQERGQLSLNPSENKLSIVPWDRMLQAFKSHEVFIWNVTLIDNLQLLVLTRSYVKPKSDKFRSVININYTEDMSTLPLVAKLLRNQYKTDKTKYMGMLLLRMNDCWRICGVLHSDVKYMDDDFRAKPTPDKDPELSKKILTLYQLLTTQRLHNIRQRHKATAVKASLEPRNQPDASQSESNATLATTTPAIVTPVIAKSNEIIIEDDNHVNKMPNSKLYFENSSMRLMLPIPVDSMQRLLMVNIGDDFTHIWFPTWRKFLSAKRIQEAFTLAEEAGKAIEMSQQSNHPKVFVTHSHNNCIFIGPYAKNDKQNVALFVKHDNHMILSEEYYTTYGQTYNRKTKASWIYPSTSKNARAIQSKQHTSNLIALKIDQVFSKHDLPPDLMSSDPNSNDDEIASTSSSISTIANGLRANAETNVGCDEIEKKSKPMQPKMYIPTKIIELPSVRLSTPNVIINPNQNLNPLPLKISSVASGEEVTLMTNGFSDAEDDNDENTQEEDGNEANATSSPESEPHEPKIDELLQTDLSALCDPIHFDVKTKIEAIDISDDEQPNANDYEMVSQENSIAKDPSAAQLQPHLKGYIYCSTNIELGKVDIEWTNPGRIKLHLTKPADIDCNGTDEIQKNMVTVSSYMHCHIRERFFGVYPQFLKLEWIFVKVKNDEKSDTNLCDFNKTDPFSVVFKDKIVKINSSYRDNPAVKIKERFVLDIYQLASQLLPESDVKSMSIVDIIKESQRMDAELMDEQIKLKKNIELYERSINRYSKLLKKVVPKQNGNV